MIHFMVTVDRWMWYFDGGDAASKSCQSESYTEPISCTISGDVDTYPIHLLDAIRSEVNGGNDDSGDVVSRSLPVGADGIASDSVVGDRGMTSKNGTSLCFSAWDRYGQ